MTGGAHTEAVLSKMIWEPEAAAHVFDASSEPYDFLTESMARHQRIIGGNEIRGTRKSPSERTREGHRRFNGVIRKYISPAEMDTLIPKFLGDESINVFAPDETIPYFGMLIGRGAPVAADSLFATPADSIFEYTNCKIDKAIFRGRAPREEGEGEPELVIGEFHIIASDQAETAWPAIPPTFGTATNYAPYVFSDASVTLNAIASCNIEEFIIVVDNHLRAKRTNALTPYSIIPQGRTVQVRVRSIWNDTYDTLYDQVYGGATGFINLVNGSFNTKFEFGRLQVNGITPNASNGKGQIDLQLDMVGRSATGAAFDLKITNVPA